MNSQIRKLYIVVFLMVLSLALAATYQFSRPRLWTGRAKLPHDPARR